MAHDEEPQETKKTPSAQQRAIIDVAADKDLLVVAGAGSGKTFTMTERIIALIAPPNNVPPEHILGLTFTKKAASELLTRVSAAVAKRAPSRTSSFMKPDVYTYDAFFQTIVRQYGLLVGFDQQTQPLSEAGARQLIATTVGEHIDIVHDSGIEFTNFNAIVDGVYALSANISSAMIGGTCDSVEKAVDRIRTWDKAFLDLIDAMDIDFDAVPDEEPTVPDLSPSSKRYSKYQRDNRRKTNGEPYAQAERTNAKIDHWRDTIESFHVKQMRDATCKRELLLTLVQLYTDAKRRDHMAEFSDFTVAAYQLVTRFPSIGERYRRRYTHVLLDEYQDTSTTQAMLLAKLFSSEDGKSAVNAVGDPFQSIYAWRGASPGAFRMFQRSFGLDDNYKPFALSETRRNSVIVLDAANHLTAALRETGPDGSSVGVREVDVCELSVPHDGATPIHEGTLGVLGYATRGQEIDGVVRFAQQAIAKHEHDDIAQGRNPEGTRPHVAVLFRGKAQIPYFQAALEEAGLTTFAVGTSSLLEQPEVLDVLALMHVVADRSDAASLMRLLATPRFGLGAADLRTLARMADARNTDYRYRTLVEAGAVEDTAADDAAARRRIVRDHAREVPNAIFAADLLIDDDADHTIEHSPISAAGKRALHHAGAVLRHVRQSAYGPIEDVMRAAVEALNLDIDLLVADAERRHAHGDGQDTGSDGACGTTAVRASIDALLRTVQTYVQEISTSLTPTLRGYLSWIDAQRSIDEGAAPMPDTPVDVILMTVHQSKGLEWDAVAVVGLQRNKFPSNQGERLSVEVEDLPGVGTDGDQDEAQKDAEVEERTGKTGAWRPPRYMARAHTWITDPSAVPVPMRTDAAILPAFPGNARKVAASNDYDPIAALANDDEVGLLDDDVFGSLREYTIVNDPQFPQHARELWGEADLWTMPQTEEFGRRLYADERRLMYVALTRAREEALLTYSEDASLARTLEDAAAARAGAAQHAVACAAGYDDWTTTRADNIVAPHTASAFWQEVHDSLMFDVSSHAAAYAAHRTARTAHEAATLDDAWLAAMHEPSFIARYNMARAARERVEDAEMRIEAAQAAGVGKDELDALNETLKGLKEQAYECAFVIGADEIPAAAPQTWTLDEIGEARPMGYFVGEHAQEFADAVVGDAWNTPIDEEDGSVRRPWPFTLSASLAERLRAGADEIGNAMDRRVGKDGAQPAATSERHDVERGSLYDRASALIDDASFGALPDMPQDQLLKLLEDKARRALRSQRMNATALQSGHASGGHSGRHKDGNTDNNNAYERFDVIAGILRPVPSMSSPYAEEGTRFHAWAEAFVNAGIDDDGSRARLVGDVERALEETADDTASADRRFSLWQRRLIDSPWASRTPYGAEQSIIVALDGVDNLVQGKLDAVFVGGIDPQDTSKLFTVVDWKTGRRPRTPEEVAEKLEQLDFYRLMLAKERGIPLDAVDGALYYVSEQDADARQIDAEPKDEATIINEIRDGIAFEDDDGNVERH